MDFNLVKMEKVFRNKIAQKYFEHFKSNSWVCECGIDSHGFIYVAWLNGKQTDIIEAVL